MSIQRKLKLILALAGTVPLLVASGSLIGYQYRQARLDLAEEVSMLAAITGWNSRAAVLFHDRSTAEHILEGLKAERHLTAACLYDENGKLFASYQAPGSRSGCPPAAPEPAQVFEKSGLRTTCAMALDGDRIGIVSIHSDLRAIDSRTGAHVRLMIAILLGSLIVTLFLSFRMQHVVSEPILNLARVAWIVTERKDYSVRAPRGAHDEVGVLINAFNGMLAQIARHSAELTRMNGQLTVSKESAEKAADALARSEKRFHATFDEGPLGMALLDSNGFMVEANRSMQELLGYARDELYGRRLTDFTHPDETLDGTVMFYKLVSGAVPRYQVEKRYRTRSGETLWARITVSQLRTEDGSFLAIAMAEDLTSHKRLEEQFRQAQKMEAIGRLAGGVAHDFNNLLTVIKGNTDLMIRRLTDTHPMCRNLGQVSRAADRAASLVEQLLAFSRKQLVDRRAIDLNAVVREIAKMLRPLIGEDIELTVEPGPGTAWVSSDNVQLEQILLNLAVNARDAMPDGGHLTIRTSVRVLEAAEAMNLELCPGPHAVLSVRDTGCGMTEEVRSHMFEPFFTTKEVGKGTGLGLSTVYGLVRQSAGSIAVDTGPGRGTAFAIYLPLLDAAVQPSGAGPAGRPCEHAGGESILVVEDEKLVRTIVCETLQERGYRVVEANNPEHAVTLAEENPQLDLLVTDMVMPRINGHDLAVKIRGLRPRIHVLYMSGYTEKVPEGEFAFLKKPFTPDDLARAVRDAMK